MADSISANSPHGSVASTKRYGESRRRTAGAVGALGAATERVSTAVADRSDSLTTGLGWFSIGLGLAQLAVPHKVAEMIGVDADEDTVRLMRTLGMRELTSGVGILTQPKPDKWMWSRVVGDVMDLALLGAAMGRDDAKRSRNVGATLAVLGVTGLDILCAKQLSKERVELVEAGEEPGEQRIVRAVTVRMHPANVESAWNEWAAEHGGEEARDAELTFEAAPGGRGTQVKAVIYHTPTAGKLGSAVAKMTHKSPGQLLGQDLRHFKMMMETGEVTLSDASVHSHMHPAQPDDSVEART